MKASDRILRARQGVATPPSAEAGGDADRYEAFVHSEGFPHMGFSLFCRDGRRHGFFYHNLENLDLGTHTHGEYLCFTHRGKAVTLRGSGLHPLFQAIMDHTLQAAYEFCDTLYPAVAPGDAVINRVAVTDLTAPAEP